METLNFYQDIADIRKVTERVVFIYNRHPETIESDRLLIDRYLRVFYNCGDDTFYDEMIDIIWDNKISFEAITRAGRKLRESYPDRYARTEATKMHTAIKEQAYRIMMSEG
jgi:hypothetical protein